MSMEKIFLNYSESYFSDFFFIKSPENLIDTAISNIASYITFVKTLIRRLKYREHN